MRGQGPTRAYVVVHVDDSIILAEIWLGLRLLQVHLALAGDGAGNGLCRLVRVAAAGGLMGNGNCRRR